MACILDSGDHEGLPYEGKLTDYCRGEPLWSPTHDGLVKTLNPLPTSRNNNRVCSAVADAFRPPKGRKEHPLVNALVA